jgi:hypothetical protein
MLFEDKIKEVSYNKIKNTITCTITTKNGSKVVGVGNEELEAYNNVLNKLKGYN